MIDSLPPVIRSSQLGHGTRESSSVRRRIDRGELLRLCPGVAVERKAWQAATPRQRHLLRVVALLPKLSSRVAVSHASAAAVWGAPILGDWPERVHVVDPARRTTQSTPTVVRHAGLLLPQEARVESGVLVTSPARTAADLALSWTFREAVVALDQLLHRRLTTREEIGRFLDARPTARGRTGARRAVAFATSAAESPGESLTRVVLHELGAPPPVLQKSFRWGDRGQFVDVVDFWWPRFGVVLEFDGRIKYATGRWRKGRSPEQIVVDEKIREDRIRNRPEVDGFARTVWDEVMHPTRLVMNLRAAGLPLG